VLQQTGVIEVGEVLMDRDLCWLCDSTPVMSDHIVRTGVSVASPALASRLQEVSGFRFLCCCPHLFPFRSTGIPSGRFAWEGICLLTAEFPEPW